tara:strand:+ start:4837 stop:5175 length:339 start_codon:yes stop_codon:yes gene_type:complete
MGYDFGNGATELYYSYNHSWIFREYFDREQGFRKIYDYKGKDLIPKLEVLREIIREHLAPETYNWNYKTHPHIIKDCWASRSPIEAFSNCYNGITEIIEGAKKDLEGYYYGD